jgi:hypothetical protein
MTFAQRMVAKQRLKPLLLTKTSLALLVHPAPVLRQQPLRSLAKQEW